MSSHLVYSRHPTWMIIIDGLQYDAHIYTHRHKIFSSTVKIKKMKYDVNFKSFISKHVIVTKYILSNIVKGIYLWQVKKNCSKKILKLYSKDTSWKKDILFLDCLRYVIVVLIFFFWNDYSWQSSITHFLLLTPVQAQRKRQREFLDEHSIKTRTFEILGNIFTSLRISFKWFLGSSSINKQ